MGKKRARKLRIPSYRKHQSGQARVTISGRDYYLGPYDSDESKAAYQRLRQRANAAIRENFRWGPHPEVLFLQRLLKRWE